MLVHISVCVCVFEIVGDGVNEREQVQEIFNMQKCLRKTDMRSREGGMCVSLCVFACLRTLCSFSGYLIGTRVLSVLCTNHFDVSPT